MNPFSFPTGPALSRRGLMRAAAATGLGGLLPYGANAQPAVNRLIVPFPAGGPADFMGRLLSEKLKDELGRPVMVDNRPGAGTRLAAEVLKNSPADGTTMLLAPVDPMFIGPAIYANMRFNPATDFKPVTDVSGIQFGLAVSAASPVKTLAQFVQAAKATPTRARSASPPWARCCTSWPWTSWPCRAAAPPWCPTAAARPWSPS
ncbi:tripartite tricarboxylate transporter substrate-binding protein [Variovorax boronicumulans]